MSIKKLTIPKNLNNKTANLVLFSNEKFNTNALKKFISDSEISYVNDLLKTSDLKKFENFVYELSSKRKYSLNLN